LIFGGIASLFDLNVKNGPVKTLPRTGERELRQAREQAPATATGSTSTQQAGAGASKSKASGRSRSKQRRVLVEVRGKVCNHALATIVNVSFKVNMKDFVHDYFFPERFKKNYEDTFKPITSQEQ
jgi:hypothetical protein